MYFGKFLLCFLLGIFLYHPQQVSKNRHPDYKQLFDQAEKLSNSAKPTDETDALALKTYLKVINILSASKADDPFLFKAYVSTGAFLQVLNRQKDAVFYYKKAIALKSKLPAMQDSVLFKPLVYCGNGYYQLDKPDTANIFYKQAEAIAEKYPNVSELERLYNTLGVIAYSVGNYSKSITYYQKAISTLTGHRSLDNTFLVFYKNNLASALKKLKQYDRALSIYKDLLKYHIETDKLMHNIGSVYLAMGDSRQALAYLKQVKYEDQKKLNDLGRAYFEEKDYTNAALYLQKAADFNTKVNHGHKNSDYGITLKYFGDVWLAQGQPQKALSYYQQSVGNLLLNFKSKDIYVNPANFNSVFNGIELLETLLAKSTAFKALYNQSGHLKYLEASLQTYLSFFKLANYIQVTYETDESRSLITDRKYASHQQPIDICLQLFKLTSDRKYIEQAFLLDEENKANTLSLYLEESKLKASSGIPPKLLKEEADLKDNITRISLKASAETDSVALGKLTDKLNGYAIDLARVQERISKETKFGRLKFSDKSISVASLQKIIPQESAILSYHIGDAGVLCFVITNDKFEFFTSPAADLFSSIKDIYKQSQYREGNNSKQIRGLARSFYGQLIKPSGANLAGVKNLVIIPDDELNYLPFEILTDSDGKNLLSRFTITYNYSCTVLQNSGSDESSDGYKLGMAPFDQPLKISTNSGGEFVQLPASKDEIKTLGGTNLFGRDATKQHFLSSAHDFNIIHLATHAYANDSDPNQSYIAFYPSTPDSAMNY
ncbi:MAG TPA: tetratricopeptide repeat protein, partial [Mucilaginibacter sp.]|nr:tetratricopeptide repeat protein [Mucilaginibacter sp.]